jgi:hypothetical protein
MVKIMKNKPLKDEVWVKLYNYSNYVVSNHGRIMSLPRNVSIGIRNGVEYFRFKDAHICSLRTNNIEPFLFCSIYEHLKDGKKTNVTVYIHRAVADHFVKKPKHILAAEAAGFRIYASHIVKDYSNNTYANLRFITQKELMNSQPKRLADPTKSWRTRRALYGKSGAPSKNKNP